MRQDIPELPIPQHEFTRALAQLFQSLSPEAQRIVMEIARDSIGMQMPPPADGFGMIPQPEQTRRIYLRPSPGAPTHRA